MAEAARAVITLPERLDETEAARILRIDVVTLRRRRRAGMIGFIKDGRKVFYLARHLEEYNRRLELPPKPEAACESEEIGQARSAIIGSASGRAPIPGSVHGMTPELARRAEKLLTRRTSTKPT